MNKKLKWLAVLFVLLAVVCNAADCASRIGLDGLLFPGVRARMNLQNLLRRSPIPKSRRSAFLKSLEAIQAGVT